VTAPDPRPYAGPGDLVTAADVAEWLEGMRTLMVGALPDVPLSAPAAVDVTVELLMRHLAARLDRERRQACERGWQAHAAASRQRGRQAREARQKGWTEWAAQRERERAHHMARALAFRAAARAR
jgi:hypothetical protein